MNQIVMKFLSGIWGAIKPHVFPVLLVLSVSFLAYRLLQKERTSMYDRIEQMQKARDEEIKKIEDAYAVERKAHEENLKRLQETIDASQRKHDEDIAALDAKKADAVKRIIRDMGDDPSKLASKVGEVTGFTVLKAEGSK